MAPIVQRGRDQRETVLTGGIRTTDSDHDQPIFRDRRKEVAVDGPDRLWVADLPYVAIAAGFV